jgi:hypothetical protein
MTWIYFAELKGALLSALASMAGSFVVTNEGQRALASGRVRPDLFLYLGVLEEAKTPENAATVFSLCCRTLGESPDQANKKNMFRRISDNALSLHEEAIERDFILWSPDMSGAVWAELLSGALPAELIWIIFGYTPAVFLELFAREESARKILPLSVQPVPEIAWLLWHGQPRAWGDTEMRMIAFLSQAFGLGAAAWEGRILKKTTEHSCWAVTRFRPESLIMHEFMRLLPLLPLWHNGTALRYTT